MRTIVSFALIRCLALSLQRQAWFSSSMQKKSTLELNSVRSIVVPDGVSNRLDSFLSSVDNEYSRSYFGGLCEKGQVKVNNRPRDKAYKVSKGEVIEYHIADAGTSLSLKPEKIDFDIIYEDKHMICINKPNGMVVHPAAGSPNGTFVNGLLCHIGESAANQLLKDIDNSMMMTSNGAIPGPSDVSSTLEDEGDNEDEVEIDLGIIDNDGWNSAVKSSSQTVDLPETPEAAKATPARLRPGVVHRLDKGTTGILVAGKSTAAVAQLSKLFASRQVSKIYLAICVGHPGETTIVEAIGRSTKNRQLMAVYDGPPGKLAISHVKTIAFDGKLSACLVRIETGRTHQIRVHLQHRRTPVLGDDGYGNGQWNGRYKRSHNLSRPLLHAYSLSMVHPFTQQPLQFLAPLPGDMRSILHMLSKGLKTPLVDETTGLLTGSFEVKGQEAGESPARKGFVPSDRVVMEEEPWTSFDLPEEIPE